MEDPSTLKKNAFSRTVFITYLALQCPKNDSGIFYFDINSVTDTEVYFS
jgi:hypothetical protein